MVARALSVASGPEQGGGMSAMMRVGQTARAMAILFVFGTLMSQVQAQCPPAAWVPGIGIPGTDSPVSLVVLPGGDVIAGGWFTSIGGIAANNIARYSPATNSWSAL